MSPISSTVSQLNNHSYLRRLSLLHILNKRQPSIVNKLTRAFPNNCLISISTVYHCSSVLIYTCNYVVTLNLTMVKQGQNLSGLDFWVDWKRMRRLVNVLFRLMHPDNIDMQADYHCIHRFSFNQLNV